MEYRSVEKDECNYERSGLSKTFLMSLISFASSRWMQFINCILPKEDELTTLTLHI
jgi:hypothetical protein